VELVLEPAGLSPKTWKNVVQCQEEEVVWGEGLPLAGDAAEHSVAAEL